MPVYFFDSSALVKCYVDEIGTDWVRGITDAQGNTIHVSSLAKVETVSALTRSFNRGDITLLEFEEARDDALLDFDGQYSVVDVTDAIIEAAVTLAQTHGLRAYDAVQLATALELRQVLLREQQALLDFSIISADLELNAAARAEGLNVEDPNTH